MVGKRGGGKEGWEKGGGGKEGKVVYIGDAANKKTVNIYIEY